MKYRLGLSAEPIENKIDNKLEGVGMIRAEYLCRQIEEYFTLKSCRTYVKNYVENICKIFYPLEVWYRTSELVAPEINVLRGADHIIEENHYTFGLRGVRRGVRYPDTFLLELQNITEVWKKYKNLGILLPYIYDPSELEQCLELFSKVGYKGKYGIMAEIPSAVLLLEDFISLGISNITIGVNDLTSLTLGTYRNSSNFTHVHPSVLKQIEIATNLGLKYKVPVSVGGYVTEKLKEICINLGVDWFIVHYTELPSIFRISKSSLPYLNVLCDIKKLTKAKIQERVVSNWREKFIHNY